MKKYYISYEFHQCKVELPFTSYFEFQQHLDKLEEENSVDMGTIDFRTEEVKPVEQGCPFDEEGTKRFNWDSKESHELNGVISNHPYYFNSNNNKDY